MRRACSDKNRSGSADLRRDEMIHFLQRGKGKTRKCALQNDFLPARRSLDPSVIKIGNRLCKP